MTEKTRQTIARGDSSCCKSYMASSTSPCAACKFLRRKCQPECVFAPYFPPDQPQKFANVHKVFGASNVTKLLNELQPHQREDAVNSLAYEADMRLRDPVYGCVGVISLLQHQLRQLQIDLSCAKSELSKYQNSTTHFYHHQFFPHHHHHHVVNHQQQVVRSGFDGLGGGNNGGAGNINGYDHHVGGGLLAMNHVSAQLGGFQHAASRATADHGRPT